MELLFLWWPSTHLVTSWRCYCSYSHHTRLAFAGCHHLLLGPYFEMCHHWSCWFGAYLGGVWSFPLSFYSSEHYFHSTSVAMLPQETHWSNGLQEACCGGTDLLRQRDRREHVLLFPVWLVPSLECPVGYQYDFMELKERWTSYRRQAFLVAFFGVVLFPSPSGAVNFAVIPLVSALLMAPFSFLLYFLRPLGLCLRVGRLVGVG